MTSHEFAVEPRLRLIVSDVSAVVRVRRGEPGAAVVEVTGGDGTHDTLKVTYDAASNVLDVREDPPADAVNVTVVGSGGVVSGGVVGGGVVSGSGVTVVHGVRTRGTTTVAHGGTAVSGGVTVVNSGGRIVVNGVDVTDQVATAAPPAPEPPPVVTVTVPEGSDIGAERCGDLTISGVRGRVRATLVDQSRLAATEATAARLTVTGQSRAELRRCSGSIGLTVTGQSQVRLTGEVGDVSLELSGQARVVGTGSFGRVSGRADGMSRVDLTGPAAAQTVQTSGMATVRVGGTAQGAAAATDDWDF